MNVEMILAAGPRALTREVPVEVRMELASNPDFVEAAKRDKRRQLVAAQRRQIEIARDLRTIENKAMSWGYHYLRIDPFIFELLRDEYGQDCWADPEFIELVYRDIPELRVITTRGTRGQEYAGRGR